MFDQPKVLNDTLEAIVGAVFVDCGFCIDPAFEVVGRLFANIVPHIRKDACCDPKSRFNILKSMKDERNEWSLK